MKNDISVKLKWLREALGLTQGQFSEKIGMKQSAYSMIENGKNGLSIEGVKSITQVFDIDANYFFKNIKVKTIDDIKVNITKNDIYTKNDISSELLFKDYNDTISNIGDVLWMISRLDHDSLTKEQIKEVIDLDCYGLGEVLTLAANKNLTPEEVTNGISELEQGILANIQHLKELLRDYIIQLHALSINAPKGSYANGSLEDLLEEYIWMEKGNDIFNAD